MKILVMYLGVWPIWPQIGKGLSGGERHLIEVCKRWVSFGHEIHILTTKFGVKNLKFNNLFVNTYVLNVPYEETLCKTTFGVAIFYALRILKACIFSLTRHLRDDYDVICASTYLIYDILPLVLMSKKRPSSEVAVYAHGPLTPSPLNRPYHSFLPTFLYWFQEQLSLRIVKKYVYLIFACSSTQNQLKTTGIPKERMRVLNNAVNLRYIQQIKQAHKKYEACYLGRISPEKGIFDLIDIWRKVCKEIPDARIVMIGGGEGGCVRKLLKEIERHDLGRNVIYVGPVDETRKYALLKSSKLFVYPSYEESWSIVVCEAMACGLPVIAYRLPAYEYVYKQGIITVPIGNEERIVDIIIRLLKNDDVTQKLSKEAFAQAKNYDWNSIAFAELRCMESLVDKG